MSPPDVCAHPLFNNDSDHWPEDTCEYIFKKMYRSRRLWLTMCVSVCLCSAGEAGDIQNIIYHSSQAKQESTPHSVTQTGVSAHDQLSDSVTDG